MGFAEDRYQKTPQKRGLKKLCLRCVVRRLEKFGIKTYRNLYHGSLSFKGQSFHLFANHSYSLK